MGEDYPLELEKLVRSAGTRIMSDIIRRVRDCSEITRTADWQIDRLNQLGESEKYIKSTIQKALKLSDEQIEEMYKNAAESAHAYNKELYKATGKDYIPYAENAFLQQITAAVAAQTKDEFKNITGSLGFAVKRGGLTVFKPIAKYYQSTLDNAVADITSGAFDYNTVIKRTVEEMTRSGLRTVDYASGHSNRIDVAVRRAVLTGLNQLTGQVQEANAEKLGAEKFEVTWHSTARPTHQPWQGRVYTKEELVSVCGLGEVDGLKGANCRHDYFPFIEGISERVYTDEQLEEMNRKENEKKAYGGKEYTAYEATQRQRYLETAIRAQRQKIKLLQEGNASEDDIISAKCKYHKLSQEYTNFSKAMDLPQERSRIYSDGLGKVDVKLPKEKQAVAKSEKSDIMDTGISKLEIGSIFDDDSGYNPQDIIKAITQESTNFVTKNINSDEYLYGEAIESVKPIKGVYDIKAHGDYDGVKIFDTPVDAQGLANIILRRKDYNGEPIRLLSCNTGRLVKGNCIAKELSKLLGVEVIAPDDIIQTSGDGMIHIGTRKNHFSGNMLCFVNGEEKYE